MKNYTLYWLTGDKEVIEGNSISDAFVKAGYGAGAIRALDFFTSDGEDNSYVWNKECNKWEKV